MQVAIVATVILGFAGEAMYKTWLDSQREKKMLTAFDKPPAPADPIFVERPLVYEMVITRGDYGSGLSSRTMVLGNRLSSRGSPVRPVESPIFLLN